VKKNGSYLIFAGLSKLTPVFSQNILEIHCEGEKIFLNKILCDEEPTIGQK
jgi:hypothetical protein